MKVLVTGGAGFIGSHLVEQLVAKGHQVTTLDVEAGWTASYPAGVVCFRQDVSNYIHVRGLIDLFEPDEIVHLAGISHTVSSALGQRSALRPGVNGLACIQDAIREVCDPKKPPRVSVASSSLLSGMMKPLAGCDWMVANDETQLNLADCYHQYCDNKLMMEMLCWSNKYQFGIPFTIFRFGTQYGPRMRPNVVTWYFIRNALLGVPMQIHGTGKQVRQHFYVKDLVAAIVLMLENRALFSNKVISIVPKNMTSVQEIAETVAMVVPGSKIERVDSRAIDVKVRQITSSSLLESQGWVPQYNLEEGIRETVEFYRGRMDLVEAGFDKRIKEQN
jgi:nucleoside-diphosphate-sugar epimerase